MKLRLLAGICFILAAFVGFCGVVALYHNAVAAFPLLVISFDCAVFGFIFIALSFISSIREWVEENWP